MPGQLILLCQNIDENYNVLETVRGTTLMQMITTFNCFVKLSVMLNYLLVYERKLRYVRRRRVIITIHIVVQIAD